MFQFNLFGCHSVDWKVWLAVQLIIDRFNEELIDLKGWSCSWTWMCSVPKWIKPWITSDDYLCLINFWKLSRHGSERSRKMISLKVFRLIVGLCWKEWTVVLSGCCCMSGCCKLWCLSELFSWLSIDWRFGWKDQFLRWVALSHSTGSAIDCREWSVLALSNTDSESGRRKVSGGCVICSQNWCPNLFDSINWLLTCFCGYVLSGVGWGGCGLDCKDCWLCESCRQ